MAHELDEFFPEGLVPEGATVRYTDPLAFATNLAPQLSRDAQGDALGQTRSDAMEELKVLPERSASNGSGECSTCGGDGVVTTPPTRREHTAGTMNVLDGRYPSNRNGSMPRSIPSRAPTAMIGAQNWVIGAKGATIPLGPVGGVQFNSASESTKGDKIGRTGYSHPDVTPGTTTRLWSSITEEDFDAWWDDSLTMKEAEALKGALACNIAQRVRNECDFSFKTYLAFYANSSKEAKESAETMAGTILETEVCDYALDSKQGKNCKNTAFSATQQCPLACPDRQEQVVACEFEESDTVARSYGADPDPSGNGSYNGYVTITGKFKIVVQLKCLTQKKKD